MVYITISILTLIIIIMSLYGRQILSFFFTILLIILGCLSSQFKRITGELSIGIEFIPFATIIFFYTHGIAFGIMSAIIMMAISQLLSGQLRIDILFNIAVFIIIGLISLLFLEVGIVLFGIILVVLFNIMTFIAMSVIGYDFVKNMIYGFGSIIFNYVLFRYFSEIIVKTLI
ncbi:MAG: hypothetical protein ACMXYG_06530 [Candidatus Woesearchaeota archaeon]